MLFLRSGHPKEFVWSSQSLKKENCQTMRDVDIISQPARGSICKVIFLSDRGDLPSGSSRLTEGIASEIVAFQMDIAGQPPTRIALNSIPRFRV
jgi:hypothetical protein